MFIYLLDVIWYAYFLARYENIILVILTKEGYSILKKDIPYWLMHSYTDAGFQGQVHYIASVTPSLRYTGAYMIVFRNT